MKKHDRMGRRIPRSARPRRQMKLGYHLILTDTDATEKQYFEGFLRSLPESVRREIAIKVVKVETDHLLEQCEAAAAQYPNYAERWLVFDRDQVVRFDQIVAQAEAMGIHVGWSNPCFEVWLGLYLDAHFSVMDSVQCCHKFGELYERKIGREYKKSDSSVYRLLNQYGDEEQAVKRAEKQYKHFQKAGISSPSKMCPCTLVYPLVKELQEGIRRMTGEKEQK